MRAALELVRSAVWYEREARWDTALETYQLAIQQLMNTAKQCGTQERPLLMAAVRTAMFRCVDSIMYRLLSWI